MPIIAIRTYLVNGVHSVCPNVIEENIQYNIPQFSQLNLFTYMYNIHSNNAALYHSLFFRIVGMGLITQDALDFIVLGE